LHLCFGSELVESRAMMIGCLLNKLLMDSGEEIHVDLNLGEKERATYRILLQARRGARY
jgi:hypothetical protein